MGACSVFSAEVDAVFDVLFPVPLYYERIEASHHSAGNFLGARIWHQCREIAGADARAKCALLIARAI